MWYNYKLEKYRLHKEVISKQVGRKCPVRLRDCVKRAGVFFITASTALALSGCMFVSSPDELYSLPKLPEEYTDL